MQQNQTGAPFLRQGRAERLIATGRAMLSVFSLLAVWLDPTEPARYAAIAYGMLAVYAACSLVLAVLAFRSYALLLELRLPSHVADLAVAILVSFFTEGPTSPFFAYFAFCLASAAVRWGWTGTLWTAAVTLAAFLGMGYYFGGVLRDPAFEPNRFILRAVYLGVLASLLGHLGIFDERLRREVSRLATWPHTPADGREPVREALTRIAGVLGLSQLLLVWEDEEEPWQYLAFWHAGRCEWMREPADTYEPLVAEPLAEASFLCADAGAASPRVIFTSEGRLRRLRAPPIHPALRARFQVGPVLSWRLRGESFQGRLFALEEPVRGLDRLLVGEILAWQAAAHLDQSRLLQRLREASALDERVRLARDLHDGIIQSLTVAALRLEALPRLLESDPGAVREEVRKLKELLADEQRELRSLVHELKPAGGGPAPHTAGLAARLDELRERIESNWGLRVELEGNFRDAVLPQAVSRQVHRLVHEAVVNAARHAQAQAVQVAIKVERRQVRIEVADDGHGFPFQGEYDLHSLLASGLGPASLRDRIASLGGSLHLSSTPRGSHLEMVVPLTAREV